MIAMVFATAMAQSAPTRASSSASSTPQLLPAAAAKSVPQNVIASLTSLPEADTVVYISPRLIVNEAAGRVLPPKDLSEMREGLSQMKKEVGVDPGNIDYVVFQIRFKKPNANLDFSLPEFMSVVGGDFSAEALMQFAKGALKGDLRDDSYGGKPFGIITIPDLAKQAERTPLLKSLSEVAVVALNGNTIAIGTTNYVKAAIDAAGGKGRISPELLNSVMRDPTALVSAAGSPGTAFAKSFALLGTENNPRAPKCDFRLGDFYAAITMDATSFKFRGAMNADNPDTAKIIKSMLSMLLQQAASLSNDKSAQAVLSRLVITPTETEVLLQAEVSSQAVADYIREQTAPKKQAEVNPTTTAKPQEVTKPIHRRRRHRRHKKV